MGELVKILDKKDVAPGSSTAVEVRGQQVAVFNVDGTFYAIGDTCTHRGGPLSQGEVSGTTVTCPWHKAQYDLKTGGVLTPPALKASPVTRWLSKATTSASSFKAANDADVASGDPVSVIRGSGFRVLDALLASEGVPCGENLPPGFEPIVGGHRHQNGPRGAHPQRV